MHLIAVCSCLLGIVSFKDFIEKFMTNLFDWRVAIRYIQIRLLAVDIVCLELAATMTYRTFTQHHANRSFYIHPIVSFSSGANRGFLLSSKAHYALRGERGFAPPSADSSPVLITL